jgi:hypothetical protein
MWRGSCENIEILGSRSIDIASQSLRSGESPTVSDVREGPKLEYLELDRQGYFPLNHTP